MVARQIILLLACVSVTWATQIEVKALNFTQMKIRVKVFLVEM